MADDDRLVGVALAHRVDDVAGELLHARVPVRAPALRELVGGADVVAHIEQIGLGFGEPHRRGESADAGGDADNGARERRRAERATSFTHKMPTPTPSAIQNSVSTSG